MEFKGTKGEWVVAYLESDSTLCVMPKEAVDKGLIDHPVCKVSPFERINETDEANAKLIAASKDLLMQEQFNLNAFTKILGMIPEEGEIPDPGQFIMDVQNIVFARFKATRAAIQKALS